MKYDKTISEDEAALYDRQIRLWGVDAQRKLLNSRILLINLKGLGAEIAKNLVLSGINSLTLLDPQVVSEDDLKSNFLLNSSSIGRPRSEACLDSLQILNPMVKISAEAGSSTDKNETLINSDNFDLVCALIDDRAELTRLNELCRAGNVMFLAGNVFGLHGYMFVDFNEYNYIVEMPSIADENDEKKKNGCQLPNAKKSSNESEKRAFQEKSTSFRSYATFLSSFANKIENLTPNKLKRLSKTYFLLLLLNRFYEETKREYVSTNESDKQVMIELKNQLFEAHKLSNELFPDSILNNLNLNEFSPVNAILGGVIAQECIKAITKKTDPIENLFVFDGNSMCGDVIQI